MRMVGVPDGTDGTVRRLDCAAPPAPGTPGYCGSNEQLA